MSGEIKKHYFAIAKDFPRATMLDEIFSNYQMCQELVSHILNEVEKEQLRSPLIATPEIVERHLELARQYGWGCSAGEVEWVFRNVVRELGCEMPDSLCSDHQI